MPRFSVLVPTFNSERFAGNAIESVLEQTRATEAEVIVVDDGSSDRTVEIARGYGHSVRVLEQPHAGTAAARNRALAAAEGEFAVLLDHDDELHPRFLERVGEELDREPSLAVISTDGYCFHERKGKLLSRTYLELWPLPPRLDLVNLIRANYVPPRAAIRVDVLRALGGFDEELSGVDDYDVWLRVLAADQSLAVVPEPLAYYRFTPGSQGNDRLGMAELTRCVLEKMSRQLDPLLPAGAECRVRIDAWQEREHLARAVRALEARSLQPAASELAQAWRTSPLRWRSARLAYFLVEGLLRRRGPVERPSSSAKSADPMRRIPLPDRRNPGLSRTLRAARRALGTHAAPRSARAAI